jgi:hypothetical protein
MLFVVNCYLAAGERTHNPRPLLQSVWYAICVLLLWWRPCPMKDDPRLSHLVDSDWCPSTPVKNKKDWNVRFIAKWNSNNYIAGCLDECRISQYSLINLVYSFLSQYRGTRVVRARRDMLGKNQAFHHVCSALLAYIDIFEMCNIV